MVQGALTLASTFHSIHLAFICWLTHLPQVEYYFLPGFHRLPLQYQEDDSSEMKQQDLCLPGMVHVYHSLQMFGPNFEIVFKPFLKFLRTLRRKWQEESGLSGLSPSKN